MTPKERSACLFGSVEIRLADTSDAELLSDLGRHLFEQTYAQVNTADDLHAYVTAAFSPERQTEELSNPNCAAWIAERAGSPIGYATVLRGVLPSGVIATSPVELRRLYVDIDLHGSGLAQRLMQVCVEHAVDCGCDVLWLGVWERNPRAISFYEKNGFVIVGSHTFVLGTDPQVDRVMALRLQ